MINGNPTTELDYSGQFVHLLYSEEGINYYTHFEGEIDPYTLPSFPSLPRGFLKEVFFCILNTKSKQGARLAIRNLGTPVTSDSAGADFQVGELINAFEEKHPLVRRHFYTSASLRLQFRDSQIAEWIIQQCLDRDKQSQ